MSVIITLLVMFGIVWACGLRAAVLFLALPILGLCFGGFCWALASMIWPSLVSLKAFATFTAMATVVAGAVALRN